MADDHDATETREAFERVSQFLVLTLFVRNICIYTSQLINFKGWINSYPFLIHVYGTAYKSIRALADWAICLSSNTRLTING